MSDFLLALNKLPFLPFCVLVMILLSLLPRLPLVLPDLKSVEEVDHFLKDLRHCKITLARQAEERVSNMRLARCLVTSLFYFYVVAFSL